MDYRRRSHDEIFGIDDDDDNDTYPIARVKTTVHSVGSTPPADMSGNDLTTSGASSQQRSSDCSTRVTCADTMRQYLYNSTLHGLRYVGERTITAVERCFFAASFVLVVCLSGYFISNIYEKWTASPVIIALNAVSTSIADIPFPAVTICNMNQARESVVRNITERSEDALLQSLCAKRVTFNGIRSNATNWSMFRQFLVRVSQPCSDVLVECRYASRRYGSCMELFNTVLTDEGLCCIFNRVHPKFLLQKYQSTDDFDVDYEEKLSPYNWTPEHGYGPRPDTGTTSTTPAAAAAVYPRPAAGTGSHMGLSVVLNVNLAEYHCSTTNSAGFKVLLHNPTETPKIADYGFSVTAGHETRVVVTPRISDASQLITRVPINQRKCVFSDEGNLTYFSTYSRKNCEMECESRYLVEHCGCVLYYMPRVDEATNICNRDDWQCYEEIKLAVELATNDTFQCNCLPGCFEINYGADVSTARLGTEGYQIKQSEIRELGTQEYIAKNVVAMHIYYEESFFRAYSKEEFIGFTEFLSNTGGLLGLFMGFSVVSIVEIVYFLSLRPYCAARRSSKHEAEANRVEVTRKTVQLQENKKADIADKKGSFENMYPYIN